MSETDPKQKIDPEMKPDTEKEEPGEKELSEEDLDKVAGGLVYAGRAAKTTTYSNYYTSK